MWTRPELSYIVNGSIKCLITLGNNLAVSSIVKHTLTHDPEISLQGKCKHLSTHSIHNCFTHNSHKLEAIHTCIKKWYIHSTSYYPAVTEAYQYIQQRWISRASQVAQVVRNLPANAGDARDTVSIPGLGRFPGEGNGNPLPVFLAWKITWTEEPDGLQSLGLQRVRHDWAHPKIHNTDESQK